MPTYTEKEEKRFLGYTSQELRKVFATLENDHNSYQIVDWLKQNAPSQLYVNERTIRTLLHNYEQLNIIEYGRYRNKCAHCKLPFYTDIARVLYCSDDCNRAAVRKRKELREADPNYKPRVKPTRDYKPIEKITYDDSFDTEITGEDSLFCDTGFLEQITGKKLKKTAKCK
jgi:hypothetical protein